MSQPGAIYTNIGLIYSKKGEWDKALEYYFNSEKIIIEMSNKTRLVVNSLDIS